MLICPTGVNNNYIIVMENKIKENNNKKTKVYNKNGRENIVNRLLFLPFPEKKFNYLAKQSETNMEADNHSVLSSFSNNAIWNAIWI